MTRNEKAVCLFGRKMRKSQLSWYLETELGTVWVSGSGPQWTGSIARASFTDFKRTPHAAARALERKIVSAHKRLGKLIGGGR